MENKTINTELLKILKTKNTKPLTEKQNELLASLGYTVIIENGDEGWSTYDYYRLINTVNNKTIVISKDRENKKGLFDPYSKIDCKNMELMDVINFLNTNERKRNDGDNVNEKYWKFYSFKRELKYHESALLKIDEEIKKLIDSKDYHIKKVVDYKEKMNALINP